MAEQYNSRDIENTMGIFAGMYVEAILHEKGIDASNEVGQVVSLINNIKQKSLSDSFTFGYDYRAVSHIRADSAHEFNTKTMGKLKDNGHGKDYLEQVYTVIKDSGQTIKQEIDRLDKEKDIGVQR
jgi:hypothetical protein